MGLILVINAGQLSLNKEEIILSELINVCCQHTRFDGNHPIMMEGDLIDQVLTNFINNGVK